MKKLVFLLGWLSLLPSLHAATPDILKMRTDITQVYSDLSNHYAPEYLAKLKLPKCHVTAVYDGDNFSCSYQGKEYQIRLLATDAPSKKLGYKAPENHLYRLIFNQDVYLFPYRFDEKNRIVAAVFHNHKNISLEMVQKGMAHVYGFYVLEARRFSDIGSSPFIQNLLQAQVQAKAEARGIWNPENWIKGQPFVNQYLATHANEGSRVFGDNKFVPRKQD